MVWPLEIDIMASSALNDPHIPSGVKIGNCWDLFIKYKQASKAHTLFMGITIRIM
jgi:hypothetical protein